MHADDRLPRYQRLRDEMVALVAARHWRPGEAIPTEQALAKSYDVAVGTVRKAVDLLVAEGLLERFQGRGTFVRRASFDSSLFRFFRFQTRQGERRIPESRILRREVVEAPSAVAATLQIPNGAKVIQMSRLRLIDGVPMLAEEIWLPFDRFAAFAQLELTEIGDLLYPVYEAQCNQVIASATETLTVEAIGPLHARLLRIEPGTPAVVIERLAYGYDRQPLEWRRSRGPASEFIYQAEIR
ncbi:MULTISPECIES: GntR family transcriptional regulator [Paraburkholderia]|uniref:GntR family transcriptional regulator n=1 Tax=Paraburkholderia hospita TaxID=169430 RepID=A0AAJ4SV66_9BURK|nr:MULTISPECIES: GntR family transcriptional regulator [Paraburkholderia]EUC19988.1 transcriptional regulator, GntR family with UTRA sensor domain containing protein [Burkholderia sp. BT03]SKC97513.1 transcriptional regulator, GntR family [Burkholderia sp. CF099]SOE90266.1 transcriptional regulator, GntR family [Burkholderia sp. YR290]AUT75214.1 GntR family transcriptional regulator [Paraburkholderia hospita]AXF05418.1 GntR family transcriptional regulator [Paraburkholderia hospita]